MEKQLEAEKLAKAGGGDGGFFGGFHGGGGGGEDDDEQEKKEEEDEVQLSFALFAPSYLSPIHVNMYTYLI